MAGLTKQNALLRQQGARLEQENAQLRGVPLAPPPTPAPEIQPATLKREKKGRRKRAPEHNRGRLKLGRANRWVHHAAETCTQCGECLAEGWIQRRIQVIDLRPLAPLEITEHRIIRRQCPRCAKQVLPKPVCLEAGRIGRCRFGARLMAALATIATVERLPGRVIQDRIWREYGLRISHDGIIGLLHCMATAGQPGYEQLQADVRASPVVHGDETSWRENGQDTTVWTVSTPQLVYVHHGRRTNEEIDTILGADFGGTIVADCYAGYDHFVGPKQRCWAHLVHDLDKLLHEQAQDTEMVAWVQGIRWISEQAPLPRPAAEEGSTHQAVRAREHRARKAARIMQVVFAVGWIPAG